MQFKTNRWAIACLSVFLTGQVMALGIDDRVPNFRLYDHLGGSHELHYFTDKKAVVLLTQDNSCDGIGVPIGNMSQLQAQYGEDVQFFMLNPTAMNRSSVAAQPDVAASNIVVLMDSAQLVGRTLQLNRTGEALVIDPSSWTLRYRGDVDQDLDRALAGMIGGAGVVEEKGADLKLDAVDSGCDIAYHKIDGEEISYAQHVAPILADNCVSCHRDGGIGPWAMSDHNMVRGFSLMIREVLLTQRMPPWHADPEVGHWANERSLGREDAQTLVSWIDAGAPRGEGPDPLTNFKSPLPLWGELGEPDMVIDIPATDIPATGVVDYQYKHVTNPLDRDVWVRASQIIPGERSALHHVITRFGVLETEGRRKGRLSRKGPSGSLAGYVPGAVARELPENTGTFLPKGATIEFQMHYTTSGVAATDESKMGVYFHEAEPEHKIQGLVFINPRFEIPAYAKSHAETAIRSFEKDALVYSMIPHAHYRGKASRFVAQYPDGTQEVLLNVPNYDFNWQTTYELAEPKFVPAGTKVVFTKWWDNSAQNLANPDPSQDVRWGEQSWEEMIFGVISYRELTNEEAAERIAKESSKQQRAAGGADVGGYE